MANDSGTFSTNLMALQLQLRTLFEGAGGDRTIQFLDALAALSSSEQQIVLELFTKTIKQLASGEVRLFSEEDVAMKALEEALYTDIVKSMREAATQPSSRRLQVLNGGGAPQRRVMKKSVPALRGIKGSGQAKLKPVLN